jgi:hypothetical protein
MKSENDNGPLKKRAAADQISVTLLLLEISTRQSLLLADNYSVMHAFDLKVFIPRGGASS